MRAVEKTDRPSGLVRLLAWLFRVAAVGLVAGAIDSMVGDGANHRLLSSTYLGMSLVFAVATWVTANGIARGRPWGRNIGVVIAVLSLFNVGIMTICGILELVGLWQAERAGQFITADGAGSAVDAMSFNRVIKAVFGGVVVFVIAVVAVELLLRLEKQWLSALAAKGIELAGWRQQLVNAGLFVGRWFILMLPILLVVCISGAFLVARRSSRHEAA